MLPLGDLSTKIRSYSERRKTTKGEKDVLIKR